MSRSTAPTRWGKIPSLVLDDKKPIFDSNVICEYLDSLKPAPVLFPRNGPERWQALALGSLADGILDAALLLVYEKRFRPEEKWHAPWQQAPAGQDRPRARSAREEPASLERQITAISRLPAPSAISISGTKANGVPDILSSWPGSISTPRRCRPSKRPSQGNSRNLADFPIKPSNVPFGGKTSPLRFHQRRQMIGKNPMHTARPLGPGSRRPDR